MSRHREDITHRKRRLNGKVKTIPNGSNSFGGTDSFVRVNRKEIKSTENKNDSTACLMKDTNLEGQTTSTCEPNDDVLGNRLVNNQLSYPLAKTIPNPTKSEENEIIEKEINEIKKLIEGVYQEEAKKTYQSALAVIKCGIDIHNYTVIDKLQELKQSIQDNEFLDMTEKWQNYMFCVANSLSSDVTDTSFEYVKQSPMFEETNANIPAVTVNDRSQTAERVVYSTPAAGGMVAADLSANLGQDIKDFGLQARVTATATGMVAEDLSAYLGQDIKDFGLQARATATATGMNTEQGNMHIIQMGGNRSNATTIENRDHAPPERALGINTAHSNTHASYGSGYNILSVLTTPQNSNSNSSATEQILSTERANSQTEEENTNQDLQDIIELLESYT